MNEFTFSYNQTGGYCNLSYCLTAVVLGAQQCLKLRKTRSCRYTRQLSKIFTGNVNHEFIKDHVPSFSQPNSLTPTFNAYLPQTT